MEKSNPNNFIEKVDVKYVPDASNIPMGKLSIIEDDIKKIMNCIGDIHDRLQPVLCRPETELNCTMDNPETPKVGSSPLNTMLDSIDVMLEDTVKLLLGIYRNIEF